MRSWLAFALVAPWAGFAGAAEIAALPDLPPIAEVVRAIDTDPMVVSARSGVPIEEANRRKLSAGTNEFVFRGDYARRQVTTGDPTGRFNEWTLALERQLRLPGKGTLDDQIGLRGVDAAQLSVGDAMHDSGRRLLRLWFGWMRECAVLPLWDDQTTLARRQLGVVQKRRRVGDAAKMELNLAEAALAQAEAGQVQAAARESIARTTFLRSFPTLALPKSCQLAEPTEVSEEFAQWRDRIAEHNHQVALARVETQRRQVQAERARADLLPDPTLGIRYSNEFGGAERVVGAFVSLPLPGSGRSAQRDMAAAQLGSARLRAPCVSLVVDQIEPIYG